MLMNIVRTVARKSSNRLKLCWLNVICCICQSNDLEREIQQKNWGGKQGASQKSGGMVNSGPSLEPRLMITIVCFFKKVFEWGEQFVSHNQVVWHIQRSVDKCWRHRVL